MWVASLSDRYTRPGSDRVDRSAVLLHRPDLHRRGVGPQHARLLIRASAAPDRTCPASPAPDGISGMLSAVKLYHCVSISGPSATEKPRSAKISASSSITWLTGWTVPCGALRRRERQVDPFRRQLALELGVFERGLAIGDCLRDPLAKRMDFWTFGCSRLGVHRSERFQPRRDLARLAEQRNAHAIEFLQAVGCENAVEHGFGFDHRRGSSLAAPQNAKARTR